ncbi:MAG: ABC transporter substrate-binding protein [Desulfobacterales bacterium]|nr:ABC transporter substrate-binding protein [Desulfobacterales bacterium]
MKHYLLILLLFASFLNTADLTYATSVTDDSGKQFEIKKPFEKIISLYPAHTENLSVMGLEKKIIGASKNESPGMSRKPVFSYHDDPEKFMAARPDLVLIRPMIALRYGQFIEKLERAGITVISLQPVNIEDMYDYWKTLGILTGKQDSAEKMVNRFKNTVRKINDFTQKIPATKRKKVYFEAIHRRMKTFSPGSMAVFVLETAGGINAASDAVPVRSSNIAAYGKERILSRANEIDVYLAQYGVMNYVTKEQIKQESGFHVIKAIKNGEIYLIDETKVSRPTPKLLEGIAEIRKILYGVKSERSEK